MSPLLGSTGGSSEYAFRGTLDDWPVDFTSALAAQNPASPINPVTAVIATLTITGLNYKARVIVEHPNATVAATSEFGVAVTDGRQIYAARRSTNPPLLIRDQSILSIRLQPTSGTISDFLKTYTIPVKVGKRQAIWTVSTRAIDETPNAFTFSPLIDQQLGVVVISNTITIAGLENGFSFPISVTASDGLGNISFYKNSTGPLTSANTVINGDQIYLSTLTPNEYNKPRSFTLQVGTFSASWSILTRNADNIGATFSFTGISSANQLGFGYTSGFMTVSGIDTGPQNSNPITWPTDPTAVLVTRTGIGSFQILKSDNTLRYTDPLNPLSPNYWQFGPTYAFNGDKINLRVASSLSYNATTSTTLNVSDKSATFNVTTRPAPIDTIPTAFTFTNISNQARGTLVTSGPVTLSGMIAGGGTASIPTSTAGVGAEFNVNNGAWVSAGSVANVQNGDVIRLRMTTPNADAANGVTNNSATFRVDGVDTSTNTNTPPENPQGYITFTGFQENIWNVTTIARTCPITAFTLNSLIDRPLNSDNTVTFTVGGYDTDCRMRVEVTSASTNYNFIALNGVAITPTKILTNVTPGSTVTLSVRASASIITDVTATVTVTNNNTPDTITPENTYSTTWTIRTIADTTPSAIALSINPTNIEVGSNFTLTWSSTNCTSIRSVSWTPAPATPIPLDGSSTLLAPTIPTTIPPVLSQNFTYIITAYANPTASNYGSLTLDPGTGLRYVTSAPVTLTVTQDTTPILTPNDFTPVSGVEPSTSVTTNAIASNIITVSSITVPLTAEIRNTSNTGSSIVGSGIVKTINNNSTIQVQVNAATANGSIGYNSTTSAIVDFLDSVGNIKATRTFSVTTRSCQDSLNSDVRYPPGATSNFVDLNYYTNASYLPSNTASRTAANLLVSQNPSTFNGSKGILLDGSTLTWTNLVGYIWNSFTSICQRPPTNSEITSSFNAINPINFANNAEVQTFLNTFASGAQFRNIIEPILSNPCENVINQSGYP